MKENKWISTGQKLPEQHFVVETKSPSGMIQDLKLVGKLWYFPDGSMYVYYTPTHWREKP